MSNSAYYSSLVLKGLQIRGIVPAEVAKITGVSLPTIKKILQEKGSFTNKQIDAVVKASGITDGKLALLATPDADADFVALIRRLIAASREGQLSPGSTEFPCVYVW